MSLHTVQGKDHLSTPSQKGSRGGKPTTKSQKPLFRIQINPPEKASLTNISQPIFKQMQSLIYFLDHFQQ